jgi:hypothetical protein
MKLERIKAADQTEFPKAKPLSRSQRVWKRSALLPERKEWRRQSRHAPVKALDVRRQGLLIQNEHQDVPKAPWQAE